MTLTEIMELGVPLKLMKRPPWIQSVQANQLHDTPAPKFLWSLAEVISDTPRITDATII